MSNWFQEIYGGGQLAMLKCTRTLVRLFRSNEIKNHPNKKDRDGNPLQYLDTSSCIDRLNEAFTPLGWSFTPGPPFYPPTPADKPGIVPHNVSVLGTMTVHTPWGDVTKSQYGSSVLKSIYDAKVKVFGTENAYNQQYAEFGDDLKSAASDALKKCATLFGVANYISRKGTATTPEDAVETLNELLELSKQKGYTREQILEFCGGVTCKTVRGAADLSHTQAQACLELLKAFPDHGPSVLPA